MATAAASEGDLSLTPTWSRQSFSKSFKRKSRKAKGSDAGSIGSSGANGTGGDRSPVGLESSPYLRRNSTDSGRKLSIRLGGRKRSKIGLGRTESESGSSVLSATPASEAPPSGGGGGEAATTGEDEYYTEEEDDT
jgi:hypothetical protein